MKLQIAAPAKVNWTLEVLGKREDGYHEIRSVMQTINLCDSITLEPADELTLSVRGATRGLRDQPSDVRRRAREIEAPEHNLAYRAAQLLRERAEYAGGALIRLDKHIPIAAGLGGGSSDAAAVLRGLRRLWQLDFGDNALMSIGAELGSDVPFFIAGGTALADGRGERIEPLPDVRTCHLLLLKPTTSATADKTASMYASLRPDCYTDGVRTEQLATRIRDGAGIRDADLYNAFESVLSSSDAARFARALALRSERPHLCGSGPAFFFLATEEAQLHSLVEATRRLRLNAVLPRTMTRAEATAIYESP